MLLPRFRLACLLLLLPLAVLGSPNSTDSVKQAFENRFPDRQVQAVNPSPVEGVFALTVNKNGRNDMLYSNADASYLLIGKLMSSSELADEKARPKSQLNPAIKGKALSRLPLSLALKEVRGTGQRQLAVFSDPDCSFCRKLEREALQQLDNVTIYTFIYPLIPLHPDAMRKAEQVWCSPQPLQAWHRLMRQDQEPNHANNCPTPLQKVQQLGQELKIQSTPTLLFNNGQSVSGALPITELESYLHAK